MTRKYYEAYDERYKTVHAQGASWTSDACTPIVREMLEKYGIQRDHELLEIGCGEGRDAKDVLNDGYNLTATDISEEAISFCRNRYPKFAERFKVVDCLSDAIDKQFDFIYAIAVIHMLVPEEDRDRFYSFVRDHLEQNGLALICTMGDGEFEMRSDISKAFELQEREHEAGRIMVAGTSCRMVSFGTFEQELARNSLQIVEEGITSAMPEFNSLMYAVVKRVK